MAKRGRSCLRNSGLQVRKRRFQPLIHQIKREVVRKNHGQILSFLVKKAPHTSDAPCRSLVEDSVSLTTTALVTCMSGCCCLASCIAIARACKERTVGPNESAKIALIAGSWLIYNQTTQLQFRLDISMLANRAETICPFLAVLTIKK